MLHERNNATGGASEFDDLETRSLKYSATKAEARQAYRTRQAVAFVVLSLCAVMMIYREEVASMFLTDNLKSTDATLIDRKIMGGAAKLKPLLMEARKNYDTLLQEQYGKYSNDAFERSVLLKQISTPSPISNERLKRRMKMKIIQAALSSDNARNNATFTWAVGGHSAAAGHGDLFNQTYGYVLEKAAQPAFAALGIEFRSKNYAMGGTSSGPDQALCLNEIYGMDLDVLSWDFGMTDGSKTWFYELWAQRAGVHQTKPSLFTFGKRHVNINSYLELAGMATFTVQANGEEVFPNSDEGDPTDLPPGVRYFRCDGHTEKGEPCDKDKWKTAESCPNPKVGYQTSWHTGWKFHQFIGHLLTGYMMEHLFDALDELDSSNVTTLTPIETRERSLESNEDEANENEEDTVHDMIPSISDSYLRYLLFLEEQDKETFIASEVPTNYKLLLDSVPELYTAFHRNHTMCHASYLPSQARYDGLVTESGNVSTYVHAGRTTYADEGYEVNQLPAAHDGDEPTPIWLGFFAKSRNICEHAEIDYKDAFIVRQQDSWMSMLVPNDSEMEVFNAGYQRNSTSGVVMICTRFCDWGRCGENVVPFSDLTNKTSPVGSILVNDVSVLDSIGIGDGWDRCYILQHAGGYYFPSSPSGQYEIKIRLDGVIGGQLHISNVIVL